MDSTTVYALVMGSILFSLFLRQIYSSAAKVFHAVSLFALKHLVYPQFLLLLRGTFGLPSWCSCGSPRADQPRHPFRWPSSQLSLRPPTPATINISGKSSYRRFTKAATIKENCSMSWGHRRGSGKAAGKRKGRKAPRHESIKAGKHNVQHPLLSHWAKFFPSRLTFCAIAGKIGPVAQRGVAQKGVSYVKADERSGWSRNGKWWDY
jgi:hypothetical protein